MRHRLKERVPAHDFGVFLESYDAARFAAIADEARAVSHYAPLNPHV